MDRTTAVETVLLFHLLKSRVTTVSVMSWACLHGTRADLHHRAVIECINKIQRQNIKAMTPQMSAIEEL